MAKILTRTIQVNLVPILVELGGGSTNLPEFLALKNLPLFFHHSYFWTATLDFKTFFVLSFFAWAAPFLQFGCFCVDSIIMHAFLL